ncbi:hypothetical protein CGSMWGv6420B_03149 [Gardnerella vaginalis 6420B]|nr:hypothetical protein CGSMWGv6420B_03149 [Gardnerella vaginalis 6420B]
MLQNESVEHKKKITVLFFIFVGISSKVGVLKRMQ